MASGGFLKTLWTTQPTRNQALPWTCPRYRVEDSIQYAIDDRLNIAWCPCKAEVGHPSLRQQMMSSIAGTISKYDDDSMMMTIALLLTLIWDSLPSPCYISINESSFQCQCAFPHMEEYSKLDAGTWWRNDALRCWIALEGGNVPNLGTEGANEWNDW